MLTFFVVLACVLHIRAIGQAPCVSFSSTSSSFPVVSANKAAPIYLSDEDWAGVHRAASDFAADIQRVTNIKPTITNITSQGAPNSTVLPILVGTLGKSSLIDNVVNNTSLDVSTVRGKWESFITQVVSNPLPGVSRAYVIIGSDKRGTIYALYELSEQFGVSPWYWWADVDVKKRSVLHLTPSGCSHGPPTVQYRGIFLNDEQPALQNWAMAKFTNGTTTSPLNSPFNDLFYANVFELLLRLKANYLWPAMWGSAFAVDHPRNQFLADYYGIAMGTSHQEPMTRSTPNEWRLEGFASSAWNYTTHSQEIYDYWVNGTRRAQPFETVYTLGMRGAGDLPLDVGTNIALLERIIDDQRKILTDVYNGTDITKIPQIWALYKEVEGYYDEGLRVEDDVILLWADDNWGNIRRFPLVEERARSGGAGVYYHFDYVGDPRNYKFLPSTQLSKVHEQMTTALERNATRLWLVNVGDLKPYEREIEFFISYGWNTTRWNSNNIDTFVSSWATREFEASSSQAAIISSIVANMTRYNGRRKLELTNSTTYSLVNYREAETILSQWSSLVTASSTIYNTLPVSKKPSYYQLVHHSVIVSANVVEMYIAAGKNNLRASQAFASTNALADKVQQLFANDYDMETAYHTLLSGKWDHFMDQTHLGYYYWQQPMVNTMPLVNRVETRKQALAGMMRVAIEGNYGAWPGDNPYQCDLGYNCPPPTLSIDSYSSFGDRYVDVGMGGPSAFEVAVTTNVTWLIPSVKTASLSTRTPEQRIFLSVPDWGSLSAGTNFAQVTLTGAAPGKASTTVTILFNAINTKATLPGTFKGFVESSGAVSIEAAHASRNQTVNGVTWKELPGLGRTVSGVTPLPRLGNSEANFTAGAGPSLEYDFYAFNTRNGNHLTVTLYMSPSLNGNGRDRPLKIATQIDSLATQTGGLVPLAAKAGELPDIWKEYVANSIVPVTFNFTGLSPGAHTLKVFEIEPTVVLQKIVIDTGGLRPSYLGPPESWRV